MTAPLPPARDLAAELVDLGDGRHASPEFLADAFGWAPDSPRFLAYLDDLAGVDLNILRPHHFVGGPWDNRVTFQPRAMVGPGHCMPSGADGATWAAADAWAGRERYVPGGDRCGVMRMVWRHATPEEIAAAAVDREARYADRDWSDG